MEIRKTEREIKEIFLFFLRAEGNLPKRVFLEKDLYRIVSNVFKIKFITFLLSFFGFVLFFYSVLYIH